MSESTPSIQMRENKQDGGNSLKKKKEVKEILKVI